MEDIFMQLLVVYYCDEELEHRDNWLAQHIADTDKCKKVPATARTAVHVQWMKQ